MEEIPASEFDPCDFDAREFVQRYRKRVPLPQLQKGLKAHHAATHQELVELINEKYADFVSLSSRMQGVERALRPLRAPLEESAGLTRGLHSKLGALLEQAEQTHQALAQLRARKHSLAAYIENAKLLDKAKAAAGQRWGNPQESDDFLREHVAHENVARDLRRVRLNLGGKRRGSGTTAASVPTAAGGPGCVTVGDTTFKGEEADADMEISPECQALLQEAATFEEAFTGQLQRRLHGFVAAVQRSLAGAESGGPAAPAPPAPPPRAELLAVAHLARALVTLGRPDAVESACEEAFAGGALDAAAAACAGAAEDAQRRAAEPITCVGAGAVDLGPFFDSVHRSLFAEGAPLLWLARRLRGPTAGSTGAAGAGSSEDGLDAALLAVPGLCLVSNAAVGPALRRVQQAWPNAFMPADPDVFAANYVHAANFVRAAEAVMMPSEQQAFARSAALNDFRRRWKTQVYSALRTKEAVRRFDDAAAKSRMAAMDGNSVPSEPPHIVSGQGFWLEVSAELMRILETVWSERWSLDALYPKTLQLSLELLARYGHAVRALAGPDGGAEAPAGGGWDAGAVPPAWAPGSRPVRLARAAGDALAVLAAAGGAEAGGAAADARGDGHLLGVALARLPSTVEAGRPGELVRQLLRQAAGDALQPTLAALEAGVLQQVAAAAAAQLAAIRGIPAFYRMLNKPVPTRASPYVESAVKPIQALRDATRCAAPAEAVAKWVHQAVDGAATEFGVQAAQLLESTHQQEASLRRLAGRGSGSDSQVSDLEKIHIQLCLDVETFIEAASELGVSVARTVGLSKLAEVIAPVRHTFETHRPPSA